MDKLVSQEQKSKERQKKFAKYGTAILIIVILVFIILKSLDASISSKNFAIGNVDKGSISISINASGKVVPLNEEIIVAPINTRILDVYKNAGDSVNAGEPILLLELASIETEYNQKLDEAKMRRSKLLQSKISIDNKLSEMQMQYKVKEMQMKQMKTDLANEHYLDSIGATTHDKIREKELNYEVAKLELVQLKQKISNEHKNSDAEQTVQLLEFSILEKKLAESARLLKDARILAPQKGTITFINNQRGAQVSVGTQIAVLSDLSHLKVEAEIADTYGEKLTMGAKAIIRSGSDELEGTVVNITPSSENGVIKFSVILDKSDNTKLRSGLRVDVHVQHGVRDNVLRIPITNTYLGAGKYDLWVIRGNKAEKRSVVLGESSYEYIEVIDGLNEGDNVILSNMNEYKNKKSLKIK